MIDLDAIEKRATAATQGPWSVEYCEDVGPVGIRGSIQPGNPPWGPWILSIEACETDSPDADVEFMAAARTDVPALCAEVRRLRLQVEAYENVFKEGQEAESQMVDVNRRDPGTEECMNIANTANTMPRRATGMELRALAAETRAERAEARASKLRDSWHVANGRNCELQGRAEKAEAELKNFRGAWSEALGCIGEKRDRIEDAEARIKELKAANDIACTHVGELVPRAEAAEERVRLLESEIAAMRADPGCDERWKQHLDRVQCACDKERLEDRVGELEKERDRYRKALSAICCATLYPGGTTLHEYSSWLAQVQKTAQEIAINALEGKDA